MISTFLSGFAKIILIPFVFIAGLAGYQFSSKSDISLSGTLPIASATYTLSGSGISSSATSITLSSFTLPQSGHEITDAEMSDTFYLTIEPGNRTRQEIVSCTTVTQNAGDTATLSGCLRGLLPITPYTASSTYAFAHSGGTSVIFSNPPQFYNQFLAADNTGTITGQYTFSTSPVVPTVISASTTNAASVQYVNAVALAGSADAAPTVKGVSKLSVTAASSTNPIVVGDNDTRIPASAAVVSYIPTSNQKLALAGYTGTPSSTNKYLTEAGLATTTTANSIVVASSTGYIDPSFLRGKFGGTSVDGALSISSGTTTIDLGGQLVVEKNYSSISITGTGALAFSNASTTGTIIILKSQGNVTLTSSAIPNIDVSGMGAGTTTTSGIETWGIPFNASTTAFAINYAGGRVGGNFASTPGGVGGLGGIGYVNPKFYSYSTSTLYKRVINITPGSAGGQGGNGNITGSAGRGGRGGGSLIIECAGAWNFTTTNGLSVAGKSGTNAVDADVHGWGGGGGGSGGFLIALYNSLTANTGTVNITGGNGGNGSSGNGNTEGGAAGGGAGSLIGGNGGRGGDGGLNGAGVVGANGSNSLSTGAGAGTGGAGGVTKPGGGGGGGGTAGEYIIAQNNFLF